MLKIQSFIFLFFLMFFSYSFKKKLIPINYDNNFRLLDTIYFSEKEIIMITSNGNYILKYNEEEKNMEIISNSNLNIQEEIFGDFPLIKINDFFYIKLFVLFVLDDYYYSLSFFTFFSNPIDIKKVIVEQNNLDMFVSLKYSLTKGKNCDFLICAFSENNLIFYFVNDKNNNSIENCNNVDYKINQKQYPHQQLPDVRYFDYENFKCVYNEKLNLFHCMLNLISIGRSIYYEIQENEILKILFTEEKFINSSIYFFK